MVKNTVLIFYMTVWGSKGEVTPRFILLLALWHDGGWGNFDGNTATVGTHHLHIDSAE